MNFRLTARFRCAESRLSSDGAPPNADFTLPPLPQQPRRVLLFVAMEAEAAPIARVLGLAPDRLPIGSAGVRSGRASSVEISLLTPGICAETRVDRIGPVHAAATLARALERMQCDLVVNAGTAGGFESQGQRIADLIIARDTLFHDARVALDGYDAVARAHTRLSPDEKMLAHLAAALDARVGLVSTGASLDATAGELASFARHRALAKEMELAALSVVCREHGLPLVAVKGITDLVDHHEPTHAAFLRNLARTCHRIAEAVPALLESIMRPARDTDVFATPPHRG
jgi:5'-methylthioadenosine nucleosidase